MPAALHSGEQWQENMSTITCQSVPERRELAQPVEHTSREVSTGPVGDLGNMVWKKNMWSQIILVNAK